MVSPRMVHLVDYLNASLGTAHQGKIVIITIRPDAGSFRPHNIALLRSQGEQLFKDLKRLLSVPLLLLLLMSGCSAQVEVISEQVTPSSADRISTFVSVDVLTEPSPKSPATQEPPPHITKLVEVTSHHNTIVNVAGDLHLHHHLHLHEAPKRLPPTSSPIRVEVQRRREDPRCERLRRDHEERVAGWKVMFFSN